MTVTNFLPTRCGYERRSGMYFEVIGSRTDARPPWLFVHGGSGTGAVFRATPDGRPGWADVLAAEGNEVWLVDWPGMGRSASIDPLEVDHGTVIGAVAALLEDVICEPVVLLGHSMGGSVVWRVAELCRALVAGVVGLAPAPPGNLAANARTISDDGRVVVVKHPDFDLEIATRRDELFRAPDQFVDQQWIKPGTRFPRADADVFRHSVVPMPPRLALQRLGVDGGIPSIVETSTYDRLWIRIVVASDDPAHTPAMKQPYIDLFRSWGADAELVDLGERGIAGNGHFMFSETNSDDILRLVVAELETSAVR